MKRNLYALLLVFCVAAIATAQVPKKILIEEATQASCGPCAFFNPNFDQLAKENKDKAVVLKYQVWWPGYDPMYEHNTSEVRTRINNKYLSRGLISGAPNAVIDGTEGIGVPSYNNPGQPNTITPEIITDRSAVGSPVSISINHDLNDVDATIDVEIVVKNESANDISPGSHALFAVSVEDEIIFPAPPGTNGETDFNWVFRKFLSSSTGDLIADGLAAGETKSWTFSEPIPTYTFDFSEIGVIAWVENVSTGAIIQAEHSESKPLDGNFADLSMVYSYVDYDGVCDDEMSIQVIVENVGALDVQSYAIDQITGQGTRTEIISQDNGIVSGTADTFTLNVPMTFGSYSVELALNPRGTLDSYRHNERQNNDVYSVVADQPFAIEIDEGFDISLIGELPPNIVLDNRKSVRLFTVNNDILQQVTWPLGGHGNSNGCMRFDMITWEQGSQASVMFNKVDLSDRMDAKLSFTYAYAARGGLALDRFVVQASSNCGADWITLFDQTGDDLVTGITNTQISPRFYPLPSEWRDIEIDLSDFDGDEEVIVRFTGIGAGINALYLDDVELTSELSVSNRLISALSDLVTFPNPASDVVNIGFSLTEAVDLDITVTDLSGKVVDQLGSFYYPSGEHNLQWNPVQNGTYLINIRSGQAVTTERVTVIK